MSQTTLEFEFSSFRTAKTPKWDVCYLPAYVVTRGTGGGRAVCLCVYAA